MTAGEGANNVAQRPPSGLTLTGMTEARMVGRDHVDEQFSRFIQESADADRKGAAEIARGDYVTLEDLKRLIREE